MTAGGYDHLLFPSCHHLLIPLFHNGSAHRRLLRRGETECLQGLLHGVDAHLIVGRIAGRETDIDRLSRSDQRFCLLHVIADLLGVLGTVHITAAAENTLVRNDMRLIIR